MNILHVIQTLDLAAGGPATVAPRLAAAQSKLGHDVAILCFARPDRQGAIEQALQHVPAIGSVRRDELPRPARWNRLCMFGLKPRIARAVSEVDVVHLHGVWEPLLLHAARVARASGVPYVVRPAGMLDPWSLSQKRLKKKVALALGYRAMLDRAAFVHALNSDEKRLIEPLGLRCAVEVVGNGVFLEELQPAPEPGAFYALQPSLEGSPYILFLGRLHEKKGLDVLADAFAHVAKQDERTHLVVAGPDDGAQHAFEHRMDEVGLLRRVHVVGPLYGRDKLAALGDAAVFCLPSRQEGFSLAITEAMACGAPVVISEGCHFNEVESAGAGIVTPLDAAAVGDALLTLLADPARRATMSDAGRRLIETQYTWPRIAEQVVTCYQQSAR